jgi:hypothetical protein
MPSARDLQARTLVQLHHAIANDAAAALATVQSLIAQSPFPDRALASAELDLLNITFALDRAQQLLHHSVQVLSGLRLPGEDPAENA